MKKIDKYILIIFTLSVSSIFSQTKKVPDLSKRLYVGDHFVAPPVAQLMRGTSMEIDWDKLKNKVVLLDFFETSCGTCIQTMPKLQQLQDQYPDKFEVIVVTWQDKHTMENFFASNEYLKKTNTNLPVLYEDTHLKELFPHQSVPHAVFLYKGKVQAITTSGFVTEENILKLYDEGTVKLPLKDDFGSRDLLANQNGSTNQFKLGTVITDYQDGVPYRSWTFERDSLTGMFKSSIYNASLFTALKALFAKVEVKKSIYIPRMDRVVWKVRDSTKYYDFEGDNEWRLHHAICYERYDSIARADSLQAQIVLKDFETFFGVKVYKGMNKMKVLVLVPAKVKPFSAPDGVKGALYQGTAVFAGFTDLSEQFPPIVDYVKSDNKIEIFPYNTLDELNIQLARYGISAKYADEDIEVLFIEEL